MLKKYRVAKLIFLTHLPNKNKDVNLFIKVFIFAKRLLCWLN